MVEPKELETVPEFNFPYLFLGRRVKYPLTYIVSIRNVILQSLNSRQVFHSPPLSKWSLLYYERKESQEKFYLILNKILLSVQNFQIIGL